MHGFRLAAISDVEKTIFDVNVDKTSTLKCSKSVDREI